MPTTNILLVHGAWVDASSWNGVITVLQEAGYPVLAVQLPLSSLDEDIATTKAALASLNGPTVLVGHSYGGAVISGAATDEPNVVGLVYVAAYALDEGESVFDINNRFPATEGVQHIRQGYIPNSIWVDPAAFPQFFAPDVDPTLARVLAVVQKPQSLKGGVLGKPAWRSLPAGTLFPPTTRSSTRKPSSGWPSGSAQPFPAYLPATLRRYLTRTKWLR